MSSLSSPMWVNSMREIIAMVDGADGEEAAAIRAAAEALLIVFTEIANGGRVPPPDDERKKLLHDVSHLYVRARSFQAEREAAPRETLPSRP